MANVLLINPAFSFEYKSTEQYIFPFGLGYIAAYLQSQGHEVEVWDIYIKNNNYSEIKKKIESGFLSGFSHIGITGIVNQYLYIKELVKDIKNNSTAIVTIGGPLASYSYELLINNTKADYCVIGYGELTYSDIISGKKPYEIGGIAYQSADGEIKTTLPASFIEDLDELPYPAYDLFDTEFYIRHTGMMDVIRKWHRDERVMALITARGCPYNCHFCSKSVRQVHYKKIDNLISEINYYIDKYDVKTYHIVDELLVLSKKRIIEFCEKIKPLNIKWDAQGRANLVDKDILKAMKDAGCVCVGFGIESGSSMILDNMNKKITVRQIRESLDACMEINLPVKVQLIYGYPGESRETLKETIDLFGELRYPARRLGIITPLPGSSLYEIAKTDGFIGEKPEDKITEEKYIEFLCNSSGWCTKDFFYNRTEFTDEEFPRMLEWTENMFIKNFTVAILLHPLDLIRHRSVYKVYLNNWWEQRNRITFLRYLGYLMHLLRHPIGGTKKVFKKIIGK